MKNKTRKDILAKVDDVVTDVLQLLEENQYEPSERGAGTATADSALVDAGDMLVGLIECLCAEYPEINKGDLTKPISLETIISEIEASQEDNIADDFDDLNEIDCFVDGDGVDSHKYRWVNTVYEHKPTGKFILVLEQRGVGSYADITSSVEVRETEKKEIVKYEWN